MALRPKLPTIRSSVIRLHKTIFRIEDALLYVDATTRLSTVEAMVLLLEDRRFFQHYGLDGRAITRELWRILRRQNHGGASTIDMQLFRTASGRYERTLRRKIREIFGALLLQRKFNKMEILRSYLSIAYFGTGLQGIEDASYAMYQVASHELDVDQAAVVASMLVYPKPRIPTPNWRAKIARRSDYGKWLFRTHEQSQQKFFR